MTKEELKKAPIGSGIMYNSMICLIKTTKNKVSSCSGLSDFDIDKLTSGWFTDTYMLIPYNTRNKGLIISHLKPYLRPFSDFLLDIPIENNLCKVCGQND